MVVGRPTPADRIAQLEAELAEARKRIADMEAHDARWMSRHDNAQSALAFETDAHARTQAERDQWEHEAKANREKLVGEMNQRRQITELRTQIKGLEKQVAHEREGCTKRRRDKAAQWKALEAARDAAQAEAAAKHNALVHAYEVLRCPTVRPSGHSGDEGSSNCDEDCAKCAVEGAIAHADEALDDASVGRRALAERVPLWRSILERLSTHCQGDRYEPHAFGETPKFIGCKLYRSDDSNEYCLPCEARAALYDKPPIKTGS